MKKTIIFSTVISAFLLVLLFIPNVSAFAMDSMQPSIINKAGVLSDEDINVIFSIVHNNIEQRYGTSYSIGKSEIMINEVTSDEANYVIDIDVTVNLTSLMKITSTEYVKGMAEVVSSISNEDLRSIAYDIMKERITVLEKTYVDSTELTFQYRAKIAITELGALKQNDVVMYHRVDLPCGQTDITPMLEDETCVNTGRERGKEYINNELEKRTRTFSNYAMTKMLTRNSSIAINVSDVIEYAYEHAMDVPTFSKANGNGSDCANFVSHCINAGGIPMDKTGGWYFNSATDYGVNWVRTGYYNNGGVVPYLVNLGVYELGSDSSSAQCGTILSWKTKSHVAIVIGFDPDKPDIIMYSEHSNVKKTSRMYALSGTMTSLVNYYNPVNVAVD